MIIIQGNILAKDSVVDFLGRAIFSYVPHFFLLITFISFPKRQFCLLMSTQAHFFFV